MSKGRPQPGTTRLLTRQECDIAEVPVGRTTAVVNSQGALSIVISDPTGRSPQSVWPPGSASLMELELHWVKQEQRHQRARERRGATGPIQSAPWKRVTATRDSRVGTTWVVDILECGHEEKRQRADDASVWRRCHACPKVLGPAQPSPEVRRKTQTTGGA